ncbi:L-2-hydroxyglutarate dehydrogenase, mitochondrial isoform X2 [Ricinus communis]|uniref:L-2-hydroxyglutarate dehydrogenase, mitochondrial isoform X2 n=1 Tax=Ricinus communis TaxID=3988 RepID=UPI00201A6549|nr:L-2-hydroxyglutarate dehydrogenase, mitochondrial isoform X2 [Ricinus communis]
MMLKHTIRSFRRRITSNSIASKQVPREKLECVVIGAGIVGIAVARELALRGKEVLVLDSASTFGTSISSRNSQVIHAGIYYPPNSFKSLFCVKGRDLLYKYCSQHGIPHKQTGKLIVATSAYEIPKLYYLKDLAAQNGVHGLRMLEGFEAMKMEPRLQCVKALFSPVSGIVDAHSLMLSLLGEAENYKTTLSYNSTVTGGHLEGLSALQLARKFDGLPSTMIPPAHFARGCYFTLSNTRIPPFQHLIYPIPEDGGLGVHVTLDLDGQVKFGPDVEWIHGIEDISSFLDRYDYTVSAHRVERFYPEIRKYYPNLKTGTLEIGYAGIRPKVSGPGQAPMDFVIQGEDIHGVPGLINLFGIESPGLTSSMAIAEYIASRFLK